MASGKPVAMRVRFWAITLAVLVIIVGGVLSLVGVFGDSDGDYGQLQLPGSTVLSLPAGQIDITFTEDSDNQTVDEPATLHIDVKPVGGGTALPVALDPNGGSVGVNGVTHTYWGYVMVPAAGDYRITVPDDVSPSIPNPQLVFGPDTAPQIWILGALPIAAVLIIVAIVTHRRIRRTRPTPPQQPETEQMRAWLYVTGVDGAPPPLVGLGPVRISGEIRPDPAGTDGPRIPVHNHEVTAPTSNWPQVGRTLSIVLSPGQRWESLDFVVLWEVHN